MKATLTRRDGFTLIETLAALAVGSVVIIATAALVRNVSLNFDRGARSVGETERIALAVERLAADLASARFVTRATAGGPAIAFSADRADGERPARIMFVADAEVQSGPQGEEIVSLAVERNGEAMRLVRRRAAWSGARMRFEDASLGDEVVLIDGRYDISFLFARADAGGGLVWTSDWVGETALPRFVRLVLRDPASGADLLGEADFVIRADAPAGCARNEVGIGCLTAALAERPSR
jgi:prepilin-type N-terminal cleavage/methylation domain-containing protein